MLSCSLLELKAEKSIGANRIDFRMLHFIYNNRHIDFIKLLVVRRQKVSFEILKVAGKDVMPSTVSCFGQSLGRLNYRDLCIFP